MASDLSVSSLFRYYQHIIQGSIAISFIFLIIFYMFQLQKQFLSFIIIQKFKIRRMKLFNLLKTSIKSTDFFLSSEMLRFNNQAEYRTMTGGFFSIAIIIAVLMGFYSMIIDTLNLNTITFLQTVQKDVDPGAATMSTAKNSKFMMAVQLWGVNMTKNYFDILMIQLTTTNAQLTYSYDLIFLEQCTEQHWADFPEIAKDFHKLQMYNWLCPPIGSQLQLSGGYASDIYKYVNISVNPCIQYLHPDQPCATSQQVDNLFIARNDAIRFKIYYTNPLINAGQKQYKSYYLQQLNYAIFGQAIGGQTYLYVSDYQITSDVSIWPYEDIIVDKGQLIQQKIITHPYTTKIGAYANFLIVKSSTSYIIDRQVQKISSVFSFMGGLVSAFSAALFILKIYNSLSFEITIALSIFKPPQDMQLTDDKEVISMNFFNFVKYYVYLLSRKIGRPCQWPKISFIRDCQSEVLKQLDIKSLIKRVIFLEYCITNVFEDYQLEGLQIKKPATPQQIRKIRQKCQSMDAFYQCEFQEQSENKLSSYKGTKNVIDQKPIDQIQNNIELADNNVIQNHQKSFSNFAPKNSNRKAFIFKKNKVDPNLHIQNLQTPSPLVARPSYQVEILEPSSKRRHSRAVARNSYLNFLKKNADEGNQMSKKIWKQLQEINIGSVLEEQIVHFEEDHIAQVSSSSQNQK